MKVISIDTIKRVVDNVNFLIEKTVETEIEIMFIEGDFEVELYVYVAKNENIGPKINLYVKYIVDNEIEKIAKRTGDSLTIYMFLDALKELKQEISETFIMYLDYVNNRVSVKKVDLEGEIETIEDFVEAYAPSNNYEWMLIDEKTELDGIGELLQIKKIQKGE